MMTMPTVNEITRAHTIRLEVQSIQRSQLSQLSLSFRMGEAMQNIPEGPCYMY